VPVSTPTPYPTGQGTGLLGAYFDNRNLSGTAYYEVNSTINFAWGIRSPEPGIGADTFSVRWTGRILPRYSQRYTFYTRSDDGVRLWVNGQQIIDSWIDQSGTTEHRGYITLVAGRRYRIEVEYYENTGDALMQLSWSSENQRKQIIPRTQLYPAEAPDATPTPRPTREPTAEPTTAVRATRVPSNVDIYEVVVDPRDAFDKATDANGNDIFIRAGQRVTITYLRGTWGTCPLSIGCSNLTAEGDRNNYESLYGVNAPFGGLLARITYDLTFFVGDSATRTAPGDDWLLLTINDDFRNNGLSDNFGSIVVRVEVETP